MPAIASFAIQLLRLHNPDLTFQGFADTSTTTPTHVENQAWIIIESGTIFGIDDCEQGQVIYSDGSAYVVESIAIDIRSAMAASS